MYLEIKNISKSFGLTAALTNVSLEVAKGTIHGICGENGAGKSTLIKILCGLIPYGSYDGSFFVDNEEKKFYSIGDSSRSRIAVIAQELALVPELSVAENILLGKEPTTNLLIDHKQLHLNALLALQQLKCDIDPGQQVKTLGIGKQQLVEIAKALSLKADIIILDEPTAALTEQESKTLLSLLVELRAKGVTSILISHKLKEVLEVADTITVLRDGASVCTMNAAETSETELVTNMVGRKMHDFFGKENIPRGEEILRVTDLSSLHTNRKNMHTGINLKVHAGEIVGIAGMMGSGRTELLQILFGAHTFNVAGEIMLCGKTIRPRTPREAIDLGIALISEDRKQFGLFLENDITFNSTISFLRHFVKNMVMQKKNMLRFAEDNIEQLKIKCNSAGDKIKTLSGGNQQKVVFSKWMKKLPVLLLADEPTRGIDVGGKAEIYNEMYNLARAGTGILMVSSDIHELIGISDRIYVMCYGKVNTCFERAEFDEKLILKHALNVES